MPRFGLGYAWLPLVSAVTWFGTVLALLIVWLAEGHPQYQESEHTVVYISDVGASSVKPLFIAGACVTVVFFVATLIADRALRHRARLPAFVNASREERFSLLSIIFGIIGSIALVLLTILDAFNHSHAHWAFTVIFVIGIAISAIFNTLETHFMSRNYPLLLRMRASRNAKIALVSLGVVAAVLMAILAGACSSNNNPNGLENCNGSRSASAVFEWTIAFIFVGYVATYIADLRFQDRPLPVLENEMRQEGFQPKVEPGVHIPAAATAPTGEALA